MNCKQIMDKDESEKVFPNGDIYVGALEEHLPHGMGKYTWLDGTFYEGEWEKGRMTGRGQINWLSGAKYEGDFAGGYLQGLGTFFGADGSVYEGAWRMNLQHGLGKKTYPNSDVYEGSWKEGVREGAGKYIWKTGNFYNGNWKAGTMTGRGQMTWSNGETFDGLWLNGLKHGYGLYVFPDGACYIGIWSKGLKDERGTFLPAGITLISSKSPYESITRNGSSSNFQPSRNRKASMKRTFSEKLPIGSMLKSSGRMSHRAASVDSKWKCDECSTDGRKEDFCHKNPSVSERDKVVAQTSTNFVYEREYMQGILISEKAVNYETYIARRNKRGNKYQDKEMRRPGQTIRKGHGSYYLMLSLQLGIRYTVGKITPVPKREVRPCDFGPQARIKMYFPSKGSQFTPPHGSIGFQWKDYCPMVFRNLREMFKIDAADYMTSICGGDGLRELCSPGKSGSIFYLSQDERFVIKTLRKSELKILLKMLPNYYKHVRSYENTLITKFFGLHRITLRGWRKVRFVVMGNMFCTELRIHRRYDLKGSSHGRVTNNCDIDETTTLKDCDLSYVFYMDKSWRDSLFKQISLDCMFLESQSIIDYSLLLGLHFRAPEYLKTEYLKTLVDHQDMLYGANIISDAAVDSISQGQLPVQSRGLRLVTHEPNAVSSLPGSHIRGSTLRASAAGHEEVDLLLPDVGRLRVQLGVNMPAQANRKLLHVGSNAASVELLEVFDVVLYLGVIDILQEYNMTKKIEHAVKSLQFDPMTISAVEPKTYSKRFINFLEKVFPEDD